MRLTTKFNFDALVGAFVDRYVQPLLIQVTNMSQQITDLQAAVTALTTAVQTTVSNEAALKQKLDAALTANVDLSAQLEAAKANQADPADAAAVAAETAKIAAQTQALSDAAAATSPSN